MIIAAALRRAAVFSFNKGGKMDFGAIMKIRETWSRFQANHPKFPMFLQAVSQKGVSEGTIMEIRFTYPDGKELTSNLRITQEDLELFETLKEIRP